MTQSWPIRRTQPGGLTLGTAIPAFIHNGNYYLTTVDVYADGAINAWGVLDRPLFRAKVATGWVTTTVPVGATISVHNLGFARVVRTDWRRDTGDIVEHVESEVRRLNPAGRNLVDLEGSDVTLRGGVRYAKLAWPDAKPVLLTEPLTVGEDVPIFRRSIEEFALERWFVFADGTSRIGTEETAQELGETLSRLSSGELATTVPNGARVRIPALGTFQIASGHWVIEASERAREVSDLMAQARGKPSSVALCVNSFREFEANPTEPARERLRIAYEAVPKHLRMYCGDMDSKDWPIKRALHGGQDPDD
jgi:hypothetical protein